MLIGELVKRSGLTKDAIRFYERKGLIKLDKKNRRNNNYKEYPNQVLEQLMLIRMIKGFGLTINEIDLLFRLWREEEKLCDLVDIFKNKVVQIDDQIKRLTGLRMKLSSSMIKCQAGQCDFDKSFPSYRNEQNSRSNDSSLKR